MNALTRPLTRAAALGALVVGLGVGSYGIADAASGTSSTTTTPAATAAAPSSTAAAPQGWGQQRSDETPLTGDALTQVTAVAKTALPGATIVRVETDADGHATYEAHVTEADGTLATVYVDSSFKLVSVETGGPSGGSGGRGGASPSSTSSSSGSIATA